MRGKNDSTTEVKIPEWIETAYKDYITKSTTRGSALQDALWAKMMPGNTAGAAAPRPDSPDVSDAWAELADSRRRPLNQREG
jgi:hypothetical protein